MSEVLSFEASQGPVYGDILSARPAWPPRIRAGLLGCGYFEYWRMFSPVFRQNVRGDLDRVAARLRQDFDLVYPGMVDTLDSADRAGRVFATEQVDLLIVVEGTYLPDFITLQALEHVPGVPVVLFTTQLEENIAPTDTYETLMRNSSLIGTAQLAGSFRKMNRAFEVVVGSIGDEQPYRELLRLARVQDVVRRLRQYNIGMIGHVFRGMYDLENDKTKIKGTLGANVVYVDIAHLLRRWEQIEAAEVTALARAWAARFRLRGTTEPDLHRSLRVGLAMERLAADLRLDALCFLGQHHIEAQTGAPARLGGSLMLEKGKCMVASEGDLAGLVLMQAMNWFSGHSPLQAEWGQYDARHNALLLVGHGVASPALAGTDAAVTLTRSPEQWGFEGHGVNLEFILRPGPVTLAHALHAADGWQMLISGGEALAHPCLPCEEIHALVAVETPVREYLATVQRWGIAHHVIVVHGDVREDLRRMAGTMGMRTLTV